MEKKEFMELANEMRNFEDVFKLKLGGDDFVVIRTDGRNFRSFTKGMKEPYDDIFLKTMQQTMMSLCQTIPGCVYAYSFSDEISIILSTDKINGWYKLEVEKIVSVTASLTTIFFNKHFCKLVLDYEQENSVTSEESQQNKEYINNMKQKMQTATFDCRAFVLPEEKIIDYLKFRQLYCIEYSVGKMYRSMFGKQTPVNRNQTSKKMCALLKKSGNPWTNKSSHQKLGYVCQKTPYNFNPNSKNRKKWGSLTTGGLSLRKPRT